MRDRKGLIFGIGGATAAVYGARSMQHLRTLGVMSHLAVSRAGEMTRSHVRWKRISGPPPAFADQSHPRSVYGDAWMNSASTESKYMLTKESTVA